MNELKIAFPDFTPVLKKLVADYLLKFDTRIQLNTLTKDVGFSVYSLKNKHIVSQLNLDTYVMALNDIEMLDDLQKLSAIDKNSTFGGCVNQVEYLHESGINAVVSFESGKTEITKELPVGSNLFIDGLLTEMYKNFTAYVNNNSKKFTVLNNLKLVRTQMNVVQLMDVNLKNHVHTSIIEITFE